MPIISSASLSIKACYSQFAQIARVVKSSSKSCKEGTSNRDSSATTSSCVDAFGGTDSWSSASHNSMSPTPSGFSLTWSRRTDASAFLEEVPVDSRETTYFSECKKRGVKSRPKPMPILTNPEDLRPRR
eukprot:CAMPEP_0178431972 /NCGR_PEP_ID=MMETSP0689_2-20121128/32138_1 /TAXON_ID=160604 /ORGANISM="Amphidinium massartii, Strain CS-259" /LENGTH=128 /DNA_ID=CAMNT_0020053931 /DNA_START=53 /DNA_END=439 /DNA_ORIENTATION=+